MRPTLPTLLLAAPLLLPACGDSTVVSPVSLAGAGGSATAGAGGAAGASAGSAGSGGSTPPSPLAPKILAASYVPSPTAPLAGVLLVALDRAARVEVVVTDGLGHELHVASSASSPSPLTLPILQLRAARTYSLSIVAEDDQGHVSAPSVVFAVTPPLPADFPPIDVVTASSKTDELTLFPVTRIAPATNATDPAWGYVVAVDATGQVVWYAQTYSSLSDVRLSAAGDIRFILGNSGIVDTSALGVALRGWYAVGASPPSSPPTLPAGFVPVAADTIHHDAIELPNGHILALSTESKPIGKATCATYDKDYDVVGDVVIEVDPATGAIVRRVSMFDLLDPCRRADAAFKGTFWASTYGDKSADWTHANGLAFDAGRNAVFVSSRHQDWVIAYRHEDDAGGKAGSLLFKVGAQGDFALAGEGARWPYHQHSPKILPGGNLMLFDNGTTRPGTVDTDLAKLPASRAVEYALDTSGPPGTWTATQVWEFGSHDVRYVDTSTGTPIDVPYYASIIGNAQPTADGTVLVTEGALTEPATGQVFETTAKKSARIFEVTKDAEARVVFDMRVRDPAATTFYGYLSYRAIRIPTLYPASAGVTAKVVSR